MGNAPVGCQPKVLPHDRSVLPIIRRDAKLCNVGGRSLRGCEYQVKEGPCVCSMDGFRTISVGARRSLGVTRCIKGVVFGLWEGVEEAA